MYFNDDDGRVIDLDCCDSKECYGSHNCSTENFGFDFKFHLNDFLPAVGVALLNSIIMLKQTRVILLK